MPTSIRQANQQRAAERQAREQAAMAAREESSRIEYLQLQYEKNKKLINGVVIGILAVIGIALGWWYYSSQKEEKAASKMFYAQDYFAQDSLTLALNGDGQRPGFLKIIRDFGGTKSANLAHYYAGIIYLKQGDAKKAISHLEDFDGHGTAVGKMAEGRLGDAYMESGNAKKAIDHYKAATADEGEEVLTPLFLLSLGQAYEKNNQPDEAVKAYKRIRDQYPQSMQSRDVDRYLAMLGVVD